MMSIFSDYAYFASYSDSWLKHCERYCNEMKARFNLGEQSFVAEVASNDGYLLQYFVKQGVPVLGIEPAANVAKVAVEKGVPTLVRFFGTAVAKELEAEGRRADLVVGNNVLAQVPDLNDFVEGLKILLKPDGVLTLEFPHLLRLIELNEFDTIYHEHFSYFSLLSTSKSWKRTDCGFSTWRNSNRTVDRFAFSRAIFPARFIAPAPLSRKSRMMKSVQSLTALRAMKVLLSKCGRRNLNLLNFFLPLQGRARRWLVMVRRERAQLCCTTAELGKI